jgi:hypothetical protein
MTCVIRAADESQRVDQLQSCGAWGKLNMLLTITNTQSRPEKRHARSDATPCARLSQGEASGHWHEVQFTRRSPGCRVDRRPSPWQGLPRPGRHRHGPGPPLETELRRGRASSCLPVRAGWHCAGARGPGSQGRVRRGPRARFPGSGGLLRPSASPGGTLADQGTGNCAAVPALG